MHENNVPLQWGLSNRMFTKEKRQIILHNACTYLLINVQRDSWVYRTLEMFENTAHHVIRFLCTDKIT
jgi:hypothetical protein